MYLFGNLNTFFPVAKDAFAHMFFEETHKASIHFENGRYHLHLEVKNQIEKTGKNQSEKAPSYESLYIHIVNEPLNITKTYFSYIEIIDNYEFSLSELDIKPQSPPPKNLG